MKPPVRYDERAHDAWVRRLRRLYDPDGPSGSYLLDDSRRAHVLWPVGCYVGVDTDGTVRYVGKICRRDDGYDNRLANHHQPVAEWARVWLLPLRTDLSDRIVRNVEATLIRALRPCDNIVRPRWARSLVAYQPSTYKLSVSLKAPIAAATGTVPYVNKPEGHQNGEGHVSA